MEGCEVGGGGCGGVGFLKGGLVAWDGFIKELGLGWRVFGSTVWLLVWLGSWEGGGDVRDRSRNEMILVLC